MDSGNKVVCENTRAVILAKAVIHEVYFRKPICSEYNSANPTPGHRPDGAGR